MDWYLAMSRIRVSQYGRSAVLSWDLHASHHMSARVPYHANLSLCKTHINLYIAISDTGVCRYPGTYAAAARVLLHIRGGCQSPTPRDRIYIE